MRLWSVRSTQSRFTVTVGAVVTDARGRVLLLNHVFRAKNGWGIPGGFMSRGESPEEALRRELGEEVGLDLSWLKIVSARTIKGLEQVEILYLARAEHDAIKVQSLEIKNGAWFDPARLPPEITDSQRRLIKQALDSKP